MNAEYLRTLYPTTEPRHYVALGYTDPLDKNPYLVEFFEVSDPDWPSKLLGTAKTLGSEQRSVFTYRGVVSGHGRKDRDVVACHYVAIDYDTSGSGHKGGYPPDLETLWAGLAELNLPRPTFLQQTSPAGYTAIWMLTTPERQGDRFNENLIKALKGTKACQGYKLDPTGNMARAVRLLGSVNHKPEYDAPTVTLVEENDTRIDPSLIPQPPQAPAQTTGPKSPFQEGDFRSILAGCRAMRHLAENPADQPEPLWFHAAGLASTCADGEKAFQEFSACYPGYDPGETTAKFVHASDFVNGEGSAPTCQTIRGEGGQCQGCPFAGKLTSPAQLGRVETGLARLASEYVHTTGGVHSLADIERFGGDAPLIPRQDFDMREGGRVASAWNGLKSLSFARKGQRLVYRPGEGRFLDGETTNTWSPSPLRPTKGAFPNVEALLTNLFGESEYRRYAENLFAFLVRNPQVQTGVIVYLTTVQGAGKDSLLNVLQLVIGAQNLRRIGADIIDSRWTREMVDILLLAINEMQGLKNVEAAAGRLKDLSGANGTFKAEAKGKALAEGFAPRLIICSSNKVVPIAIDETDRRTFAPPRATRRLDPDVGAFLNTPGAALEAEAAAFLDHLLHKVDLTGFDHRRIPDSDVRQAMIRAGRVSLYLTLREAMDAEEHPFDRELLTATELELYLIRAGEKRPPKPQLGDAMRELGWTTLGQVRLPNGDRPSLWVRTTEKHRWDAASPAEIMQHLDGPPHPQAFTPALVVPNNMKLERVI